MKNQNGFGLVGFVVLLPFLLSILATIGAAALAFKADAHLKHECRVSVLNSQQEAADKLKQLMNMNLRASALRTEYQAALAGLEAAQMTMVGPAIALAEAEIQRVQALRFALSIEQKALITLGKAVSYAAPYRAKGAVMAALSKEVSQNRTQLMSTRSLSRMGKFNVVASPEGDLTPDYNPADTFTKDQVVDLDVTVDVASFLPKWLRDLLPDKKLTISSHCQATIEKQENKWVETLNQVK